MTFSWGVFDRFSDNRSRNSDNNHLCSLNRYPFSFLPDEYVLHNECRNVQLNLVAGSPTGLTANHFHLYHPEWQEGPWCYVWNILTEMYEPQRCFEPCPGNWTPMITTTTTAGKVWSVDLILILFFVCLSDQSRQQQTRRVIRSSTIKTCSTTCTFPHTSGAICATMTRYVRFRGGHLGEYRGYRMYLAARG